MVISKRAWHYRLIRWTYAEQDGTLSNLTVPWWARKMNPEIDWGNKSYKAPKNLCIYFWLLASSPLVIPIGLVIAVSIHILSFAVASIVLTLLYSYRILRAMIRFRKKRKRVEAEEPHGNILVEYVKARKGRYCPLVEYTE